MSGYGEMYIYPTAVFDIVEALRRRATATTTASPVDLSIGDAGAAEYVSTLLAATESARTALNDNVQLAARTFALAATRTIDADVAEEGAGGWRALARPGSAGAPTDDAELLETVASFSRGANTPPAMHGGRS